MVNQYHLTYVKIGPESKSTIYNLMMTLERGVHPRASHVRLLDQLQLTNVSIASLHHLTTLPSTHAHEIKLHITSFVVASTSSIPY